MKKLILIFTLLLSSLNLSANKSDPSNGGDIGSRLYFMEEVSVEEIERKQQSAQESFDRYEMFLEYNAQQDRDNPTGSRVSEELMADAKVVAELDLIEYAILETLRAAVDRDRLIRTSDPILQQDVVDGINAAREIIGPLTNNPVFSVDDQSRMSTIVNDYVRHHNKRAELNFSMFDDDDRTIFIVARLRDMDLYWRFFVGRIGGFGANPRDNIDNAARFTENIATFFTNQNAIQSTCPGGGSCASPR